jgi:thiamine kinase-like enzyme
MAREYTYAAIGDKYFCLQASVLVISWILLIRYRALHLESLGIPRRQLPGILKSLIKFRLFGPPDLADTVKLPIFGHLLIKVHRGHKIFNFLRSSATKCFDDETGADDARKEIMRVTDASSLNFAPTILETDPGNRWYTETFVPGKRSLKKEKLNPVTLYEDVIADYLCAMITSKPVRTKNLSDYFHDLQNILADQLTDSHLSTGLTDSVRVFVDSIYEQIRSSDEVPVALAWTHGDFSFVNFIYTANGILVIDWEDARERSLLHDLFNYFFTEIFYNRPENDIATELNDAIRLLFKRPGMEILPESPDTTDIIAIYRWLYYLERMIMLLHRDGSANRSRVIQRTIEIFTQHES